MDVSPMYMNGQRLHCIWYVALFCLQVLSWFGHTIHSSLHGWGGNGWDFWSFCWLVDHGVSNILIFRSVCVISCSYLCFSVEFGVAGMSMTVSVSPFPFLNQFVFYLVFVSFFQLISIVLVYTWVVPLFRFVLGLFRKLSVPIWRFAL